MFAELERRVAEKRRAGIDVISLGIGDPDRADLPAHRRGDADRCRRSRQPPLPDQPRPRGVPRACASFYDERFGVEIDPESEVMPAIGAKECIYNLCFAFLDPGDVALAADPGYPVYTGGPALAGAEPVLMPLRPELGFVPDLDAIPPRRWRAPASCSSTTRTTPPARWSRTASSSAWSSSPASTRSSSSTTTPTRRRPTTATWRRASWRPRAPRRSGWRSSRCRRAST